MKRWKFDVKPYLEKWLKNSSPLFQDWFKKEDRYIKRLVKNNTTLLDVGCGFGRHLKIVTGIVKKAVGIDTDKSVLDVAEKRLSGYKNVDLFLENAQKMHFKNNSFDYVICMGNTFGDMVSMENKVLGEMKRVAKKNGKIIISVFSENALKERIKNLKIAGFKILKIKDNKIFTGGVWARNNFQKKS
jgi:2-polyprenyl-6-hydroxyphenyl methylase/3-demethylubiquinone-9 3-methyltransferase